MSFITQTVRDFNNFCLNKGITKKPLFLLTLFFLLVASALILSFTIQKQTVSINNEVQAQYSNFVVASGKQLTLNGNPYKFIGVNRYNLATPGGYPIYYGCGADYTTEDLTSFMSELKGMRANAVRFWLFQGFTKNGTDFSKFDTILNLASQNGIKVIPVLENQWESCTQGGYKYNTWYQTGYKAPYGDFTYSFKDYINIVVTKYKDHPNILMWQIINEGESKDTAGNPDFQSFYNFAVDVSSQIKSIDQNHLVSLGTMGGGQPGTAGDYYKQLYSIPTIDILENHDYNQEANSMPDPVNACLNDAVTLNKPIFIGEAGIAGHCTGVTDGFTCYTDEQRAGLFNSKMSTFFAREASAGYLIWSYRDSAYSTTYPPLDFNANDPLTSIISNISNTLPKPTSVPTIIPTPTNSPTIAPTPTTKPTIIPTPTPAKDTIVPTVNIAAPANNSTFKRNTSIKITADARDNVKVNKVVFMANNSTICTDTTIQYGCSWRPSKAGTYTVKETAYDSSNNTASASITINITQK